MAKPTISNFLLANKDAKLKLIIRIIFDNVTYNKEGVIKIQNFYKFMKEFAAILELPDPAEQDTNFLLEQQNL